MGAKGCLLIDYWIINEETALHFNSEAVSSYFLRNYLLSY